MNRLKTVNNLSTMGGVNLNKKKITSRNKNTSVKNVILAMPKLLFANNN